MRSKRLFKYKGRKRSSILFLALSFLFLLARCGSSEPENEKRIDNPADQEKAKEVAKDFYRTILDRDSTKMYGFFSAGLDSFVPHLISAIDARIESWGGEPDSFEVVTVKTSVTAGKKGDTTDFTVTISALYPYAQSWDVMHIIKIGSGPFELDEYDFYNQSIRDCSDSKQEEVRSLFANLTESLANYREDEVPDWFRNDEKYYRDLLELRNEFFPESIKGDLKAEYRAGHLRQYCGSQNNSNGFLTYKVSLGDTAERYITYVFSSEANQYNVYRVVVDYVDNSDKPADLNLAKQLAREIFRMMKNNDYTGYFNAMHEDLQFKENDRSLTETEVKDMVEGFKKLGRLDEIDRVTTLSVERTNDQPIIYYVTTVKVSSDEGKQALIELDFKADKNGKIKLFWMEEL